MNQRQRQCCVMTGKNRRFSIVDNGVSFTGFALRPGLKFGTHWLNGC